MTVDGSVTSQFGSSLLIALSRNVDSAQLRFSSDRVSAPYFEMTRRMLRLAGVDWGIESANLHQGVWAGIVGVGDYTVEGDWSSAAFMCGFGPISAASTDRRIGRDGLRDVAVVQMLRRFERRSRRGS